VKTETLVGLFILGAIGIFFYLSFTIGSFRVDRDNFHSYKAYFSDTAGLEIKDPVKIAGVDVGKVVDIKLQDAGRAMVVFLVNKKNKLAKNAVALVRQESLLGNKFLEIDPGDSSTGYLIPGSALSLPSQAPASVSDLLNKFNDIASNLKSVVSVFKDVFASNEGAQNLKDVLKGFAKASDTISNFSGVLERVLTKNEQNMNGMLEDFKVFAQNLRQDGPSITSDLRDSASQLRTNVLPSISSGMENFGNASKRVGETFETLDDTAVQARESFKEFGQVAEKINTGKGLVGKIINEDETYNDFKKTMKGLRDYTSKMHSLDILVDMHSETMFKDWKNKAYFELRFRPEEDYFYNLQIIGADKGSVKRQVIDTVRYDRNGNILNAPTVSDLYKRPDSMQVTTQTKNDILFGLQFGKRFNRLAFRIGLFESTFGAGVDYYVPLNTDKLHWISSLEAFDFKGVNRMNDNRPHIKWLNRFYFMKHLYTAFGVDDVISKNSASPFLGAGIRFGDKDLKYFLSSVPIGSVKGS